MRTPVLFARGVALLGAVYLVEGVRLDVVGDPRLRRHAPKAQEGSAGSADLPGGRVGLRSGKEGMVGSRIRGGRHDANLPVLQGGGEGDPHEVGDLGFPASWRPLHRGEASEPDEAQCAGLGVVEVAPCDECLHRLVRGGNVVTIHNRAGKRATLVESWHRGAVVIVPIHVSDGRVRDALGGGSLGGQL